MTNKDAKEYLIDHSQIDCPMNQTECDENCVYYNKLLLKCPMKVKGNGGEQDDT